MSAAVLNQARLACCRALFQLRPRLPTSTTQRSQTGVAVAYPRPRGYASVEDDLDILGQEAGIVRIDRQVEIDSSQDMPCQILCTATDVSLIPMYPLGPCTAVFLVDF